MKKCYMVFFLLLFLTGCNPLFPYKNNINSFGQNDLMKAIYYQDLQMVKELVKDENNLNEVDIQNSNILHYTAVYGTADIAAFLVNQPVEQLFLKKGGIRNNLPLQEAILAGNFNVFKIFSEYYSGNLDEVRDDSGKSLLHYAVIQMDESLISDLLEAGMDPNLKDIHGNTPGHLFLYTVSTKPFDNLTSVDDEKNSKNWLVDRISRNLIESGMDLDIVNKKGETFRTIARSAVIYVRSYRDPENHSLLDSSEFVLSRILSDYENRKSGKDEN
ncbi:ankyrin repeat domain-containing protein [Planococcus sp. CAU13]|uniref:ankyrin repeat domain-containing protein n=1 Tax=Planococcus sp. CAU13 TaxID=1541197 RepID=UPI00052FE7D4|nr:ankyrin repeat domain-containing protein [Planococcus sp. CAU13]